MITDYYRPETLEEALALLARDQMTLALGGGTLLNAPQRPAYAVADLQALGLTGQSLRGKFLDLGAGLTLQETAVSPELPDAIKAVVMKEATQNLRNQATLAGALVAADGRSPLAAAMLALDAQLAMLPGEESFEYGQVLHMRSGLQEGLPHLRGRLITQVTVNTEVAFAYDYVARSPADRPVVTVAAAAWSSGRLRLVVGGWGRSPRLALDAPEPGGVETAARSAAAEAGDEWATAEYRREAAAALAKRVVEKVTA